MAENPSPRWPSAGSARARFRPSPCATGLDISMEKKRHVDNNWRFPSTGFYGGSMGIYGGHMGVIYMYNIKQLQVIWSFFLMGLMMVNDGE